MPQAPPVLRANAPAKFRTIDTRAEFNRAYQPLYYSQKRFMVLYGGAGSGKSVFAVQKKILRMVTEPGHCFLIVRKVAKTLRHSCWALFIHWINAWGLQGAFRIRESEMVIEYLPTGSKILCVGLDDAEKIKSIVGITGIWVEEATEISEDDLVQLNLRLRGETKFYKQIALTFNPISEYHWLKKKFFDAEDLDRVAIKRTTYLDNAFIDSEYKAELEKLKDENPYLYRVYTLGEWGVLKGLVYDPWPEEDFAGEPDETIYGLDFGYNNPTALVEIKIRDRVPFADELIYGPGLTTAALAVAMKEKSIPTGAPIYADAAEPDRIEELSREGFNIWPADKGQGSVRAGIDKVRAMRPRISTRSGNVKKELHSYVWREDKNGKALDEPAKFNDHGMDAIRYALFTHFSPTASEGFFSL